jgi:hypothetical protein
MSRLARQGGATSATWSTRANGALRPSLASVKSRSVVPARRGGSELPIVAVLRRHGSRVWFHGKGVVAHRPVATWMWSCCSPFRQAIVMAAAWTGLVVARGSRRRKGVAVVRVPSQQRSFPRMVAREASPGVRSSHRSRPGGAQRSWNDVRRCRAALPAVPSSPWPPRVADQYTAAAGEFVVSLEGSRFAPLRRKCRSAPSGAVRGSPARVFVTVPWCWKASFRLMSVSPSIRATVRSRPSPPGRAGGRSSSRWSRCWKASCRLSRKPVAVDERS